MKKVLFILSFLWAGMIAGFAQNPEHLTIIKPNEIDDVLQNPGMGFTTFQRFNGDPSNAIINCGDFQDSYPYDLLRAPSGEVRNPDYPETTIAYLRWYWIFLEPEEGQFRWDIIDRALETARERGQTLMMAVMPYGSNLETNDVPLWYREMVGPETTFRHHNPVNKWFVDPEDPRYLQYYGRLVRKLAERYDGHPDLESIDIRIVGAWGEGGGTGMLKRNVSMELMDLYLDSFKKTPLKLLLTDAFSNQYAISRAEVGYRADCLGDLGFWAHEQHGWTHMHDYYPQGIIEFGLRDAWKRAPVSFEMCGTFPTWDIRQGYTPEDVKYIFDQALKWHISSFNGKSTAIPAEYMPQVEEFMKRMGYRFVLRRFSYPTEVVPNQKVDFTTWWENKGVAPVYRPYRFAIRVENGNYAQTYYTGANVREWLPGDNLYNGSFFMPSDIPSGEYNVQVALLDDQTLEPAIKLAIEGKQPDGWYHLGVINVKR